MVPSSGRMYFRRMASACLRTSLRERRPGAPARRPRPAPRGARRKFSSGNLLSTGHPPVLQCGSPHPQPRRRRTGTASLQDPEAGPRRSACSRNVSPAFRASSAASEGPRGASRSPRASRSSETPRRSQPICSPTSFSSLPRLAEVLRQAHSVPRDGLLDAAHAVLDGAPHLLEAAIDRLRRFPRSRRLEQDLIEARRLAAAPATAGRQRRPRPALRRAARDTADEDMPETVTAGPGQTMSGRFGSSVNACPRSARRSPRRAWLR